MRSGRQAHDHAEAIGALTRSDPILARLIDRVGPCRLELETMQSAFRALAEAIVYQQLTGRAAATILGRVVRLFRPKRFPRPEDILGAPESRLRAAGLSRAKVAALKDLSAKTLDGTVPPLATLSRMEEEEIVTRLTSIRGVGRWTVEMLLIFRLGRPASSGRVVCRRHSRWPVAASAGGRTAPWRAGTSGGRSILRSGRRAAISERAHSRIASSSSSR